MTLIEMFRRFVSFLKPSDLQAGLELLNQFDSLPVKETVEFGFSLRESPMIIRMMLDHQRRLKQINESTEALDQD